jgi:predicted nucleic acid-binding protein
MPFALDTSIVVASLCSWHPHHAEANKSIEALLHKEPPLILPAQVLMESFSVLTRLPPPHRVSPAVAFKSLRDSFQPLAAVVSLGAESCWRELERAASSAIMGGMIHDAIIARCAQEAGASKLLTLNPKHFARFAAADFAIIVPLP